MKRKITTLLLAALLLICTAVGFAACKKACEHTYSDWAESQAATCTESGEETRTCSKCGSMETRTVDALGHTYSDWTESRAAACAEQGEETRICAKCGNTETRTVDALGHEYAETGTTDESGHYHACTRENCGGKSTEAEIDNNNDYACDICGENLPVKLKTDLLALVGDGTKDSITVTLNLAKNADATVFAAIVKGLENAKNGSVNLTVNGAETIPADALKFCFALGSITLGDSVKTVGMHAFAYCPYLTGAVLSNNMETLPTNVFYSTSLKNLTLPKGLKTVEAQALSGTKLETIVLPDSVTTVEEGAFFNNSLLKSITFGKGVTKLSDNVLGGCPSLTEITFLSPITEATSKVSMMKPVFCKHKT